MEIRVLRYFVEVARERSLTRAAVALHVSQPTLSKQLKDLERELGCTLFTRTNYGITLTDEGMLLRRRAEDILDMVDKTEDEFHALDEFAGGDVRIGCAESQGIAHIARCIRAVQERNPHVRFHLYSGNAEDLAERIDSGLLDFAVLAKSPDPARYTMLELPDTDTWGVIMRADSALAQKDSIALRDLVGLPLILSREAVEDEYPRWFGDKVGDLNVVATYNLMFNASILVREGVGYAVSFDRLADTSPESGLAFRPLEPRLTSTLAVVWKKYQVFTPVAQLLLDEMRARFAGEGGA